MKKLRYRLEYLVALFFLFLLNRLSLKASFKLAEKIGSMWFSLHRARRMIAIDNVLKSGITQNRLEAAEFARKSFQSFALVIVESLRSEMFLNENEWRNNVTMDIPQDVMNLINNPDKGMILISGHLGNWEIAGQIISYFKPVSGITRRMDNPYTNKLMESLKPRKEYRPITKYGNNAFRFLQTIKDGGALAILNDQHGRRQDPMIPFFGIPAYTHTTPARLHLAAKVPLCFGYCIRTEPGKFRLHMDPPIQYKSTGDKQADIRAILEILNRSLEDAIRKHPGQYLWAHRRWKQLRPLE